ncbi:MAG TPA: hypothetical protein VF335_09675 [Chitinivibrionales bacterium]
MPDPGRSVFGAALPAGSLMFLGAIAGVIAGADAQSRGEPILYLLAPAWFFQTFLKLWKLLRYPRSPAWPFPLGLSYAQRRGLARKFLGRMLIDCCVLSAAASTAFCIAQSMAMHRFAANKFADSAAVFFCENALLYLFMLALVAGNLLRPTKSDFPGLVFRVLTPRLGMVRLTALSRFCAGAAKRLLPGGAAILAQRQALYLLRMDFFSLSAFPPLALAITGFLLFYGKGNVGLVGEAAAIIAPFLLMIDRTPVFDEAAKKLFECSYYQYNPVDRVIANAGFAAVTCAPFAVMILLRELHHVGSLLWLSLHVAAILLALSAAALCMTLRWLQTEWTMPLAAMAATSLLCGVLACAIPQWGIVFPVFALGTTFAFAKNHHGVRSPG